MNFKELLIQAKEGNHQAKEEMLEHYKPLILKESIIDGIFDEDLYQELSITLLRCIFKFDPDYNAKNGQAELEEELGQDCCQRANVSGMIPNYRNIPFGKSVKEKSQ